MFVFLFFFFKVTVSIERKTFEEYKSEIKVRSFCNSLCISSFSTAEKKDSRLMTGKSKKNYLIVDFFSLFFFFRGGGNLTNKAESRHHWHLVKLPSDNHFNFNLCCVMNRGVVCTF